jgi:hypothetical protein
VLGLHRVHAATYRVLREWTHHLFQLQTENEGMSILQATVCEYQEFGPGEYHQESEIPLYLQKVWL